MMGYDCNTSTDRKARRPHQCHQCLQPIHIGVIYRSESGIYEGDPYRYALHIECSDAARAYAKMTGRYYDEWPWFSEDWTQWETSDFKWMKEKFPVVYERLGWDCREDAEIPA